MSSFYFSRISSMHAAGPPTNPTTSPNDDLEAQETNRTSNQIPWGNSGVSLSQIQKEPFEREKYPEGNFGGRSDVLEAARYDDAHRRIKARDHPDSLNSQSSTSHDAGALEVEEVTFIDEPNLPRTDDSGQSSRIEKNPSDAIVKAPSTDQKSHISPLENRGIQPSKIEHQSLVGKPQRKRTLSDLEKASKVAKDNPAQSNFTPPGPQGLLDSQTSILQDAMASTPAGVEYTMTAPPQSRNSRQLPRVVPEPYLPYEYKNGRYFCRQKNCGPPFKEEQKFINHMTEMHGQRQPYRCDCCDKNYSKYRYFKDHWQSEKHEEIFRGKDEASNVAKHNPAQSSLTAPSPQDLLDSQTSISRDVMACTPLGGGYTAAAPPQSEKPKIRKRILVPEAWLPYKHNGETFSCRIGNCNSETGRRQEFDAHAEKTHKLPEPYVCPISFCQKSFPLYRKFAKHIERYHLAVWETRFENVETGPQASGIASEYTDPDRGDPHAAASSISGRLPNDTSSQSSSYVPNKEGRGSADIDREPAHRIPTPPVEPPLDGNDYIFSSLLKAENQRMRG